MTIIMYGKETLELENVRQMLQNNKLLKKTDSTEEASGLIAKGQRGRSQSRGPKRDPKASSSFACYFCKKVGHIKKNYMKYKEMVKKKGDKDSDRPSNSGKSDQAGVVWSRWESMWCLDDWVRKGKILKCLVTWLGVYTPHVPKKRCSVFISLTMEALFWWVTTPCARRLTLATSIWEYLMERFKPSWTYVTFQI